MNTRAWIMLITLSVIWGGSFYGAEIALRGLSPMWIVAFRVLTGAVCLGVFLWLTRTPLPHGHWCALVVMGMLNNAVPFTLIVFSQQWITSGLASILNATTPIWTVILAHYLTRDETLTPLRLFGILLGFVGVCILFGGAAWVDFSLGLAQLGVVMATLSYALAGIYGRRFKGLPSSSSAFGMLCGSSLIMLPLAGLVDGIPNWQASLEVWLATIVLMGGLCTMAAYLLYFALLKQVGATNTLLVTYLIPLSGIFLGVVLLNERLMLTDGIGLLVIFASLMLLDARWKRQAAVKPPNEL